jgi:3-oxoacyl-[acyl-carrier protein] reductase
MRLLVTGGSRGLGLEIVRHYLAQGWRVATLARADTAELEACRASHGPSFRFAAIDSADTARVEGYVTELVHAWGGLDGLVNNAAIGQDHLLANMPPEEIDHLLAVNLRAPILLTRMVVRHMMVQSTPGRIVNITSICAIRGFPGLAVYSATKGGMEAFARSLARELGSRDIRVNNLAPGFFSSAMSSVLARRQLDTIQRRTPTGRLTTEKDLLPALDLLLSPACNVTGITLPVDGGASI